MKGALAQARHNLPSGRSGRAVAWGLLDVEERDRLKEAGPVPETLEWVALLYRVAVALAEPPVKSIQGVFGTSQRTAFNWVAKARALELLEAEEAAIE